MQPARAERKRLAANPCQHTGGHADAYPTEMRFTAIAMCALALGLLACDDAEPDARCADAAQAPPAGNAMAVSCGPGDRRSVALVFEAGSGVPGMLDALRSRDARATFIVTGRWAEERPDLLNAIAADGHQVINGSYNGASFTGESTGTPPLTSAERALELSRTETTVFRMSSRSTRPFFAPPFGDYDGSVLEDAGRAGYAWLVAGAPVEAGAAVADVRRVAAPGAILHIEGGVDVAAILDALQDDGYEFERVAEIIE